MSKELTEQWKKRELALGSYYVKDASGRVFIDEYIELFYVEGVERTVFRWEDVIVEVVARVPSHYQFSQLLEKIEELEKRLDVSKKALKEIIRTKRDFDDDPMNKIGFLAWGRLHDIEKISKQALKEIKEVK